MGAGAVLAWTGAVAHAAAWLVVRSGRSVWVVMALVLGLVGVAALLVAPPRPAEHLSPPAAVVVGLAAGVALYVATVAFMFVARGWPLLARHASSLYRWREGIPLGGAILLAALVVAPGEELLWRGLIQERLVAGLGGASEAVAAMAAWGAYVVVNALGGSLPVVLGAAVGGAAWGALAVVTGGVVSPILCHAAWTTLMILLPPVFSSEDPR